MFEKHMDLAGGRRVGLGGQREPPVVLAVSRNVLFHFDLRRADRIATDHIFVEDIQIQILLLLRQVTSTTEDEQRATRRSSLTDNVNF